jgi:transposase
LHHLYRAMTFLGEEISARGRSASGEEDQRGRRPFAPRCNKDLIEEKMFLERRDLFTGLDLVFFDTTSIYFEGEGGESLGQKGHSRDRRPDLNQMVVGAVIDSKGKPVCCEMWPGNTADVNTLIPEIERLRTRFHIGRFCIVADGGMISEETLKELDKIDIPYILGTRMRKVNQIKRGVLSRQGRYRDVYPEGECSKDPAPLKSKRYLFTAVASLYVSIPSKPEKMLSTVKLSLTLSKRRSKPIPKASLETKDIENTLNPNLDP